MQQVAQGLASLGRGDDKMLVHMTPGEVKGLQQLAMSQGGSLTINPHTGLPEAGFLSSLLPALAGAAAIYFTGGLAGAGLFGMGAGATGALAGAATGALQNPNNRLRGAIGGGLSGYSGGNLAGNLMNTGAQQIGTEAVNNAVYGATANAPVAANDIAALNSISSDAINKAGNLGQLGRGIPGSLAEAGQFAKANATNLLGVAAPAIGGYLMNQPTPTVAALEKQKSQFYNTRYNPQTGRYDPVEISDTMRVASGGQIQAPSMPMDLSQNYPGSNITKSSYASLPSTQPQEIVDGYGPKINPFTGAEGMAAGGGIRGLKKGDAIYSDAPGAGPYSDAAEEGPYSDATGRGMYTSTDTSKGLEAAFKKMSPTSLSRYKKAKNAAMQAAAVKEEYSRAAAPLDYDDTQTAAHGGLMGMSEYAAGGKLLRGAGDGMSDDIPAVIKGDKPQRAALADGEFVIPADVVSHLGNGSTDAGAKRLYAMMDKVRQARTGRKAQGRQIKAEKYIPA